MSTTETAIVRDHNLGLAIPLAEPQIKAEYIEEDGIKTLGKLDEPMRLQTTVPRPETVQNEPVAELAEGTTSLASIVMQLGTPTFGDLHCVS